MAETKRPADPEIQEVSRRMVAANNEFAKGNAAPLKELCSQRDDVTLFGGAGAYELGWEQVGTRYGWASSNFSGGRMTSTPLTAHVSGDLACTVELEHWEVRMAEGGGNATIELRATQVYRREGGTWKLVHRHADSLSPRREMTAIVEK